MSQTQQNQQTVEKLDEEQTAQLAKTDRISHTAPKQTKQKVKVETSEQQLWHERKLELAAPIFVKLSQETFNSKRLTPREIRSVVSTVYHATREGKSDLLKQLKAVTPSTKI